MKSFDYLKKEGNSYYITQKLPFRAMGTFKTNTIQRVFDFSYNMTFGHIGEHRNHRSGGVHMRKSGEIFANTFQGKLAECALYNELYRRGIKSTLPDFEQYGLGKWDVTDLEVNNKSISIKSTKAFGNLLLLETKDWNSEGKYIPNDKAYDFSFLVRMNPYCEEILRKNRLLYSEEIDQLELMSIINDCSWEYDIPGFVSLSDLVYVINQNYILPQNALLNGTTKMDAENYYVQAGAMHSIDEFTV